MRLSEMRGKRIAIWGTGREGKTVAQLVLENEPQAEIVFLDEKETPPVEMGQRRIPVAIGETAIAAALQETDILVKSPGVSLYHPLIEKARAKGVAVTSLLNIWADENEGACIVGITGTKGKSTTSSLLGHVLNKLGKRALVLGNIGVPVGTARKEDADVFIVEVSSYQAADFTGHCAVGVLTSLFPEHLNWHGSEENYIRDKANLLLHSDKRIVEAKAYEKMTAMGIDLGAVRRFGGLDNTKSKEIRHSRASGSPVWFNGRKTDGMPACAGMTKKEKQLGVNEKSLVDVQGGIPDNAFLARPHNQSNVRAALAVLEALGMEPAACLRAMADYRGLPHRQQEVGVKDGVLYVDDSISTTPQSALAALEVYAGRRVTLIAGGYDRGVDVAPLADYIACRDEVTLICMGATGLRLFEALAARGRGGAVYVASMDEAVAKARAATPEGGVILLSPAAPSFGMFKDYEDRAAHFLRASGFVL